MKNVIARVLALAADPDGNHSHIDLAYVSQDKLGETLAEVARIFGLTVDSKADLLGNGSVVVEIDFSMENKRHVQVWTQRRHTPSGVDPKEFRAAAYEAGLALGETTTPPKAQAALDKVFATFGKKPEDGLMGKLNFSA